MGDLSTNFNRREFRCKCGCGSDTIDAQTLEVLEMIRAKFGPVRVHSGHRCVPYNKRVGGASNSQHLWGRAADISIRGVTPMDIYRFLEREFPKSHGFGLYPTFVHVDTRSNGPARWMS